MQTLARQDRLTSRERVRRTLRRQDTDRVPVNYLANGGIDARLKAHFGLAADDGEGLRCALGVDFRGVQPIYRGPRLHAERPGRRVNPEWGIITRWVEHGNGGGYWDFCDYPLAEAGADMLDGWPMPSPDDYDYSGLAAACRATGEFGVFTGSAGLGDLINSNGMLFGMEQVLVAFATDDEAFLRFVDRKLAVQLEVTRRTLEAAQGGIDFLWIGEDLGTQHSPLIGLDLFRRHFRPRHQRFVDLARAFGIPVMTHCCGSSSWAFEDYIQMGISVVDTLQPEARDMSPQHLKATYGGRLAFHGSISTAGAVAFGTEEETVAHCRETLAVMMPGGGYCFAPTHCLQDNTPTENALAMYRTAHEHGRY